jgi:hypothetical protein
LSTTTNAELREARFIAAVIKDSEGARWQECRKLPPDAFTDYNLGKVWKTITTAATYEEAATARTVRPFFANETTGIDYENDRDELLFGYAKTKGVSFTSSPEWLAILPTTTTNANLLTRLHARRFDFAAAPAEPIPRFLINRRSVCTAGNLTNIIAQAKAGKTAVVAAFIAAAICAEYCDTERDTLGITATAPGSKRLIHFDTEQSIFDHDQLVRRAMRRAGVDTPPAWLDSYSCAGFSAAELRQSLTRTMTDAQTTGGVFAVIIDGTADLVNDVNVAPDCNVLVAELHALAIKHDCPIINIVHENPSQDSGKMRGHLGSQLERKAESNLRLRKADEITVVFSDKMRKAPILEKDGLRFRWSDEVADHVSCETAGKTKDDAKREALREEAESAFVEAKKDAMSWSEMKKIVGEKKLATMRELGVIRNEFGSYKLAK